MVLSDLAIAHWVASQLGQTGFAGSFLNAFGTFENRSLIGGVVFHNYYPKEGVIEMSAAGTSPNWLSREMLQTMFGYAFDVLGCQLVVMRVSEINTRMLNIGRRFGFESYLIPRLRGKNEGEFVMTLTDDAWRESPFNRSK